MFYDAILHLVRSGKDIEPRQLCILGALAKTENHLGVRELAGQLNVSRPAITRASDTLEGLGLVKRVQSKADRRLVEISSTAKGRAYWREVEKVDGGMAP